MQARELVEVAALIAVNGRALVQENERLAPCEAERYWSASKCRGERWSRALRRYTVRIQETVGPCRLGHWRAVRPAVEEILLSEVLTRVWTALAAAHDRGRGASESEPIARSVLFGQAEARNRALSLIVYGQGFTTQEAVELNRLRRRTERWNDMLLGCFAEAPERQELSFDPQRTEEFAADLQSAGSRPNEEPAGRLILASLESGFRKGPYLPSPNADLNAKIAGSVLACLPAELSESTGLLQSLWLLRLEAKSDDTQGLLTELLSCDAPGWSSYAGQVARRRTSG
jgi:hypothetical protein